MVAELVGQGLQRPLTAIQLGRGRLVEQIHQPPRQGIGIEAGSSSAPRTRPGGQSVYPSFVKALDQGADGFDMYAEDMGDLARLSPLLGQTQDARAAVAHDIVGALPGV
jgi:hypothetical protein